VRKADDKDYQRFNTYEIVDPGTRKVSNGKDWIEFVHELKDSGSGYAYVYRKKLQLAKNTLVIEHELRNTGRKRIDTSVYNHNFFTLDNHTTGPDLVVRFPFELKTPKPVGELAQVAGREITFPRVFERGQTIFTELDGFGPKASDYDIRVENRKTGAGVHITSDRPLSKLVFWSAWKTVCPEPYIDASADPGKASSWRLTYEFYQATPPTQGR
jgi:galactose mutarotase-like enzyme